MGKLGNKDGRTRTKEIERLQVKQPFYALEEDFSNLFLRAMHLARSIRYYASLEKPDGDFASLYRFEPLVILHEIKQCDTTFAEQEFMRLNHAGPEEREKGQKAVKESLFKQITEWHDRLNPSFLEKESSLLQIAVNQDYAQLLRLADKEGGTTRHLFYFLLRSVSLLQQKYTVYLEDLLQGGRIDPSLAVLVATIRNYQGIVKRFNNRWKDYPRFYMEHILQRPDGEPQFPHAWFAIGRNPEVSYSVLPENTVFQAAVSSDMPSLSYRTEDIYYLNNMRFDKIYSLALEKDREKYPAARLGYVTSVLQTDLSDCIEPSVYEKEQKTPRMLFERGESGPEESGRSQFVTAGLVIESPMFLLREGIRQVEIGFGLTVDSDADFRRLADEVCLTQEGGDYETKNHLDFWIYKILNDALELEISAEEDWIPLRHYTFLYEEEERMLRLMFSLDENVPPTAPCSGSHGCITQYPAVRMQMNREAWLFPYSWMTGMKMERLTVHVSVAGITSLEIHNGLGQIDPANPFPPFGSQPEQGAWLAFGNYEMASKPLSSLTVHFHWQQLPGDECGFYDHYRGYPGGIDNASFRIRIERLSDKRWTAIPDGRAFLFATFPDGEPLSPRGMLADRSYVHCPLKQEKQLIPPKEEKYRYGLTREGFYRIVLEEPEMGFGQMAYREVFADVMIYNSSHRKKKTPPALPVIPILDRMEAGYTATEEYRFTGGEEERELSLYYLSPLQEQQMSRPDPRRPVPLIKAPQEEGNLFFAIRNAMGNTQIRFLMEMGSLKREVEAEELPHIQWHYLAGSLWTPFSPESVGTDTTESFLRSGLIELNLPHPITEKELDRNGNLWIAATLTSHTENCSALSGVYLNPVRGILEVDGQTAFTKQVKEKAEAFRGKFDFEKTLPGLTEVYRICNCNNGRPIESFEDKKVRVVQHISHRNRAIIPADYEQIVLAEFPEVEKIMCLPGIDTKGKNRKGLVTLVVMQRESSKKVWPLCEPKLLLEIEQYIQSYVSPFVTVDAITPEYEKITVRGWFGVEPGKHAGLIVREAEERIDRCIAPWYTAEALPVFGHSFSSADLYNTVREDASIKELLNLSVLHVTHDIRDARPQYRVHRYYGETGMEFVIAPSAPWCILVPEEKHLLSVCTPEGGKEKPGIGDLQIGGTFIINE